MKFIDRLKTTMELRKFGLTELAEKSGINKGTISKYLNGKMIPKQDKVIKLARTLNVSPSYLMGLSNEIYIPIISPQNSLVNDKETEMKRAIINEITEIISYQDLETLHTILGIVKAVAK